MSLKAFVKINTVNNLSDARYCAGMGVDLMGFCLEEDQPGFIPLDKFKEISEWLSGVEFVGEFTHSSTIDILDKLSNYGLRKVQVEDVNVASELKGAGHEVIFSTTLAQLDTISGALNADLVLIQSEEVPDEHQAKILRDLSGQTNLLLATGINEHNVLGWIERINAHGIALSSGNEIRPGYKDYDELANILELLEVEE